MKKLVMHLWDQLINDENAARIWLHSAGAAVAAFGAQAMLTCAGDMSKLATWTKWNWLAAAATTIITFGAKASSPSGAATPQP